MGFKYLFAYVGVGAAFLLDCEYSTVASPKKTFLLLKLHFLYSFLTQVNERNATSARLQAGLNGDAHIHDHHDNDIHIPIRSHQFIWQLNMVVPFLLCNYPRRCIHTIMNTHHLTNVRDTSR